ncbi:MAG: TldD/PmbA family protein [Candidatus Odinarchaeota archaeon]|nr:TldD/PmbA family protein [Candidatus Odinarchaeota archaeon]
MMEHIEELCRYAINSALQLGADEVEVYAQDEIEMSLSIKRNEIRETQFFSDRGLGIRVVVGKRLGFAYTNDLRREKIEETAKNAISLARARKPDNDWTGFPVSKKYPNVEGLYDRRIESIDANDVIEVAMALLDSALDYDPRIVFAMGGVGVDRVKRFIFNTNGISAIDKGTFAFLYSGLIAREGENVSPLSIELDVSRSFKLNPTEVSQACAERAVKSLNAKKIKSGKYDVIFTQYAFSQILEYTLVEAIKADNVQNNRSPLIGKINQMILNERLTIIDDGTYAGGFSSGKFDDEGVPSQRTVIFEKGVLKSYLYDNYTAKKFNKESTGNGLRKGSSIGASIAYTLTPSIHKTNLIIAPGKASPDELISEIKEGIIVWNVQGAHSSNPSTGEFSVAAAPAWKIENGEIAYPVKGALVSDTIFSMLSRDLIIANNLKMDIGYILPWILARNVPVACQ